MMHGAEYNDRFAAVLHEALGQSAADYPLKRRVDELVRNREVEELFPGRGKLWLQKELSKWRSKLKDGEQNFCGTLQSLQLYCVLTGQQPNDVLLPAGQAVSPSRIEFLRSETIYEMAEEIVAGRMIPQQGCALPVLYAPGQMMTVFLFIYPVKKAGKESVCMRFAISEPDGYVDYDGADCIGGISTAADSLYYTADLYHPDGPSKLREAYEKIRAEFESMCGMQEGPLHEAIGEFYDMMGSWTAEKREDLLFAWFPPRKERSYQGRTAVSLGDVLGQHGFKAERER